MKQRCMGICCRWMAGFWVVVLAGCTLDPPTLPQATPTSNATPVAAGSQRAWATATSVPTTTPPPAPTTTPPPASTATPPRSSPTPFGTVAPSSSPFARTDDGYCQRTFGASTVARFSARLRSVQIRAENNSTDVVLLFDDVAGVLHGVAACRWASAWPQTNDLGAQTSPGTAFIALDLPDWAHDDAFAASILTDTLQTEAPTPAVATLPPPIQTPAWADGGGAGKGGLTIAMSANSLDSRGALLGIGLAAPRPFMVRVQNDRVIVSIADEDSIPFPPANDPLGEARGAASAEQSLFFVQDETLFRIDGTGAQPVSTTLTTITGLATNHAGTQVAVCAADPDQAEQHVLWLLDADGGNERILADVGDCAEPVFSIDDDTVAFVGPAANGLTRSTIWTVPVTNGEPTPVHDAWDQWTRSAPRWLERDRLVYHAVNENGAKVLLINESGAEREVSARLLTGTVYRGVGAFVVDGEQDLIAVQAQHAADDGVDLVLLRADGSVLATEQRGFRQQPLGFTDDGLLYLTSECPSDTVQPYALRRRSADGMIETLLTGSTMHSIDAAVVQNDALLYVRTPAAESITQSSDVWLLANGGTTRTRVYQSQTRITHFAPASAMP